MKKHLIALTALLAVSTVNIATAQADVGVSVSIGQPGFYGQLDIGDYYPRPQLIYAQPRVIHVVPAYQYAQPIYLRVPPGYVNRWSNYCDRYNACGRPVYFVQDTWYQNVYAPRYQQYRQRGDDGRRYDRDYWDKHSDRRDDRQGHYDGHDNTEMMAQVTETIKVIDQTEIKEMGRAITEVGMIGVGMTEAVTIEVMVTTNFLPLLGFKVFRF